MKFPCIKCSLCCRSLNKLYFLSDYDSGGGICRYLSGNLCSIYNERPEICNVEKMYHSYFKKCMNENEFIIANLKSCLELAKENEDLLSYKKLMESLNLYQEME
jgi:Fe-S-cluster containining protein